MKSTPEAPRGAPTNIKVTTAQTRETAVATMTAAAAAAAEAAGLVRKICAAFQATTMPGRIVPTTGGRETTKDRRAAAATATTTRGIGLHRSPPRRGDWNRGRDRDRDKDNDSRRREQNRDKDRTRRSDRRHREVSSNESKRSNANSSGSPFVRLDQVRDSIASQDSDSESTWSGQYSFSSESRGPELF